MSAPLASLLPRVLVLAVVSVPALGATSLRPEAVEGWKTYVAATEARIVREFTQGASNRFLAMDFAPNSADRRRQVMSGTIVMEEAETADRHGAALDVPAAMVHHWRGAVFIPGARLEPVLDRLRAGVPPQQDVLESAVLERGPDRMRVYLRLQRKKIVTVVYNSEHVVTFARRGPTRASSASAATRIAEVEDPGSSDERELAPGHDRGFLWRLNSYWRYEEVPGGVIAECESLSLSRPIPAVFRFLAGPIISDVARESLARTLTSVRAYLQPTASPRGSSPAR